MKRALVIDIETTSLDIHSTEIVQCAVMDATLPDLEKGGLWSCLARPNRPIPQDSIDVHKITNEKVAHVPHFSERVEELKKIGEDCDLLITFNGCAFDLPILRRVTGMPFDLPHIDVMRVWQVARERNLMPPGAAAQPHASRFTGALGSAWSWLTAREPTGEHDAGEDCRMTLDVCRTLVREYGLESAIAWTSGPLPGRIDWAGKIQWRGDRAVLTFGKHRGQSLDILVKCDRNYLMWILRGDFHEHTKKIVRDALDGRMPSR